MAAPSAPTHETSRIRHFRTAPYIMFTYWMISNRDREGDGFGSERAALSFWVSEGGDLDDFSVWIEVDHDKFRDELIAAADNFPSLPHEANEQQKHVTFLVHGYNVCWQDAAKRYQQLCNNLYSGDNGLGICVSFDWPSLGSVLGYLPDRAHARACADDLAIVLTELYSWLLVKQRVAFTDQANACKAKISLISHSMGNYVTQKAMASAWSRANQPLSSSLVNQLIMVAADVDNDLFEATASDGSDGNAVSNLCYRVTSLYSGRDAALGVSAGLKHFGTRRLGRSGLANEPPTGKDNVWDVDCSSFFPPTLEGMRIHSAYFDQAEVVKLMGKVLTGLDRSVLVASGATQGSVWP
jgi:esterase/lipase superfamily enzyme